MLTLSFLSPAGAQTITTNLSQKSSLRSLQLSGGIDSNYSLAILPQSFSPDVSDSLYHIKRISRKKVSIGIHPLSLVQQLNTHHPFGWNDGAMIPANGYQLLLSAGVQASAGPVEVQVQPEFVYAANSFYPTNGSYGTYTGKSYQKIFPGQSYLRISAFSLSAGVSTENLWWGPGMRSSLLMSNNAPGFFHGFLRTQKPLNSPIGNFEFLLMGGTLRSNPDMPFENNHLKLRPSSTLTDRYLNSLVITYNPKWTPGMFLGFTRSIQRYNQDIGLGGSSFVDKYLPILFKPIQKNNTWGDDTLNTDQLASFFLRWMFLRAKAEFYIEYGYNDYGVNVRDYLLGPSHSAAYLVGFRKVIRRSDPKKFIELGFELTQMSQTPDWLVRNADNWYIHSKIEEGYTHENQILGAGGGLGTNVLSLDATWVNGGKRLGFVLERINRDPQYHPVKWIDLGLGVLPQLQYKQFLFSGIFKIIKSRNYMWEFSNNVFNVHTRLAVQYKF